VNERAKGTKDSYGEAAARLEEIPPDRGREGDTTIVGIGRRGRAARGAVSHEIHAAEVQVKTIVEQPSDLPADDDGPETGSDENIWY
jgi:hypothetical protein